MHQEQWRLLSAVPAYLPHQQSVYVHCRLQLEEWPAVLRRYGSTTSSCCCSHCMAPCVWVNPLSCLFFPLCVCARVQVWALSCCIQCMRVSVASLWTLPTNLMPLCQYQALLWQWALTSMLVSACFPIGDYFYKKQICVLPPA